MYEVAKEALEANGAEVADVVKLFPHQANRRILDAVSKRLGLVEGQMYINVDKCGNTSGASIPLALDEANRAGLLQEGDLVLLILMPLRRFYLGRMSAALVSGNLK